VWGNGIWCGVSSYGVGIVIWYGVSAYDVRYQHMMSDIFIRLGVLAYGVGFRNMV